MNFKFIVMCFLTVLKKTSACSSGPTKFTVSSEKPFTEPIHGEFCSRSKSTRFIFKPNHSNETALGHPGEIPHFSGSMLEFSKGLISYELLQDMNEHPKKTYDSDMITSFDSHLKKLHETFPNNIVTDTCSSKKPEPFQHNGIGLSLSCTKKVNYIDFAAGPDNDLLEVEQLVDVPRVRIVLSMQDFKPRITQHFQVPWDPVWESTFAAYPSNKANIVIERFQHAVRHHVKLWYFRINPGKFFSLDHIEKKLTVYKYSVGWIPNPDPTQTYEKRGPHYADLAGKLTTMKKKQQDSVKKIEMLAEEANLKLVQLQDQMFALTSDCNAIKAMTKLKKQMHQTIQNFYKKADPIAQIRLDMETQLIVILRLLYRLNTHAYKGWHSDQNYESDTTITTVEKEFVRKGLKLEEILANLLQNRYPGVYITQKYIREKIDFMPYEG